MMVEASMRRIESSPSTRTRLTRPPSTTNTSPSAVCVRLGQKFSSCSETLLTSMPRTAVGIAQFGRSRMS